MKIKNEQKIKKWDTENKKINKKIRKKGNRKKNTHTKKSTILPLNNNKKIINGNSNFEIHTGIERNPSYIIKKRYLFLF